MKIFAPLALILVMTLSLAAAAPESTETPRLDSAVPLTPEELYEIALHHNPDYLKTLETQGLSGINNLSAWGSLMPSLDVNYGFSQSKSYSPTYVNPDGSISSYPLTDTLYQAVVDTTDWTIGAVPTGTVVIPIPESQRRNSGGSISLQESIPLGGQQLYGIKNARITNNLNTLQVLSYKNDLFLAVRQNYYNVLAQKQLLALAEQLADQRREFLRAAQARFEVGSVTELDVLQAEIDVGTQDNAVITARNNLRLAREDLNRTLGINLESQYALVESMSIFSPDFSLDSLISQADTRPDYRMVGEQVRFQENLVKLRRGQFLPVLSAGVTHSRSQLSGTNVGFTFSPRNYSTSASVSLSWNLFTGFSDKAQYEQSKVSLNNAKYDRQKQALEIEREVRQAYYSLEQTYQKSDVTQKNRDLASRQLALEQERYRLGSASQLDLRTAQTTFEQAQSDYIANVFSFWINLAALERAVGQKLR